FAFSLFSLSLNSSTITRFIIILQLARKTHTHTHTHTEKMSAFNAFKANVPVAWSPNLYITLVRGIPGTRQLHRRTLEALRLTKCNRTVMRWTLPPSAE
ncbi:hypothetical protein MIMGU_mgv1a021920mg, partial [Erythranthe guttata]